MLLSSGDGLSIKAIGNARIPTDYGYLDLTNVNYCPTAPCNMLSPGVFRKNDLVIDGETDTIAVKATKQKVATFKWRLNVAVLGVRAAQPTYNFAALPLKSIKGTVEYGLMHKMLGHAGPERVLRACQRAGIKIDTKSLKGYHCEACHLAKVDQIVRREPSIKSNRFLSHVYWDFIKHKPKEKGGFEYSLHAIDLATNYHWTFHVRKRNEVTKTIDKWRRQVEMMSGCKVQVFVFDNAKEITEGDLDEYCNKHTIATRTDVAYVSAHQGKIERAGRTLMESARASTIVRRT